MPSIHNTIDWLAARLRSQSHVTLRFTVHQRLAPMVEPLIERLLPFDDDGETYRCSISHWILDERPVLHTHRGVISTLRVDGPLQDAGRTYLPLGGLIEAPHLTAHLDPITVRQLDRRLQDAIDEVIQNWIIEHGLYGQPRQRREIDRPRADREAKRIIAAWVSDATADASGEACREGSDHA